jgi:hypothetical protein
MVAVALVIEPVRAKARLFYVWMAAVCALVAFAGFAPTYWLQLPAGTFVGSPLVHIHGALFSIWTLLLLSQTLLVANGRLNNHRAWGLAGISLATSMVGFGMAAALGPPPPLVIGLVPSLLTELLIVAGVVYDWRTRGRPHSVWLIGAAVTTAVILLRGPLSGTQGWLSFADALAHIAN